MTAEPTTTEPRTTDTPLDVADVSPAELDAVVSEVAEGPFEPPAHPPVEGERDQPAGS